VRSSSTRYDDPVRFARVVAHAVVIAAILATWSACRDSDTDQPDAQDDQSEAGADGRNGDAVEGDSCVDPTCWHFGLQAVLPNGGCPIGECGPMFPPVDLPCVTPPPICCALPSTYGCAEIPDASDMADAPADAPSDVAADAPDE
jgi:hypothetical protein